MQLTGVRVGEEDRALLDALIENIDDDGYFSGSMHALCAEAGRSIEDGQRLLELVQQLSPRGVGARDLAECLALQIDDGLPYADVIRDMLRTGLDDLAENRTTKLMRVYHLTIDDLAAIREVICTLDPRPGSSFSQRKGTVYVIPDITIRRDGTAFSVQVTGELSETLVLNGSYDRMDELTTLVDRINKTNGVVIVDGKTLSEMITKRDFMVKRISIMREFLQKASNKIERYSRNEIMITATVDVKPYQKIVDKLSYEARMLDAKIQYTNWNTELI